MTGASGGLGTAICDELEGDGWAVEAADLAPPGGRRFSTAIDVTNRESVETAVTSTVERHGRIDLLVNNAGIGYLEPLDSLTEERWESVIDVNLTGAFRCLQAAAKSMAGSGGGAVVNISSVTGLRAPARRAAYVASKAGLDGLTRAAAVEWAPKGIRVNAVAPGWIDGPALRANAGAGRIDVTAIEEQTPLGRLATGTEVAKLVLFLASDDAAYITGQVIYVDGGMSTALAIE